MAVLKFAETWALLMQAEMTNGALLEDIANDTSDKADIEGITGYMYGVAISILCKVWKYGDELRKWHNKKYGVPEGVVNSAVITVA